jgi:hypothetical protein
MVAAGRAGPAELAAASREAYASALLVPGRQQALINEMVI